MKKLLYTILFLLTISSGLAKGQAALLVLIFGEKVASENFYFSLKAGLNYSMITGVEDGNNRVGFNFGLVNNIRLNDKLFLTPEFLALSTKGVSDVPVQTTGDEDLDDLLLDVESTDRKLNYLDIPVLLKYSITERLSISAGPEFSFLLDATDVYYSSQIDNIVLNAKLDIKEHLNFFDLAGVIDLSYMVAKPVHGKGINIYLRYSRGFLDIPKDNPGDPYKNSTLQIGASFPFIEVTE
ncbi:MAG: porin family protein [Bacteroidota bacterium]